MGEAMADITDQMIIDIWLAENIGRVTLHTYQMGPVFMRFERDEDFFFLHCRINNHFSYKLITKHSTVCLSLALIYL